MTGLFFFTLTKAAGDQEQKRKVSKGPVIGIKIVIGDEEKKPVVEPDEPNIMSGEAVKLTEANPPRSINDDIVQMLKKQNEQLCSELERERKSREGIEKEKEDLAAKLVENKIMWEEEKNKMKNDFMNMHEEKLQMETKHEKEKVCYDQTVPFSFVLI